MKIPVLILSFLVLLLNSIPCCILDECEEEIAQEQTSHEEEPCESCSPFLSCGTCHGFVVQEDFEEEGTLTFEWRSESFESREKNYSGFISSIWQPPQLY